MPIMKHSSASIRLNATNGINMRTVFYLSLAVLSALYLTSCRQKKADSHIMLGSTKTDITPSYCFKEAVITPLLENVDTPMSEPAIMKFDGKKYYCLDNMREKIFVFDEEGNQQFIVNRLGHGHGEYVSISDFDFYEGRLWMLCFPNKVMCMDENMELESEILLEKGYSRICVKDDNVYLYSDQERSLHILENKKTPVEIFKEEVLPSCPKSDSPVFYKAGERLFYASHGSDVVYSIDGRELSRFVTIDYDGKEKTLERYSDGKLISGLEHLKYASVAFHSIMDLGDKYMMIYTYPLTFRACFIDKRNGNVLKDGILVECNPIPSFQYGNRIFGYCFDSGKNPLDVPKGINDYKYNGVISEYGNFVIVEYKCR